MNIKRQMQSRKQLRDLLKSENEVVYTKDGKTLIFFNRKDFSLVFAYTKDEQHVRVYLSKEDEGEIIQLESEEFQFDNFRIKLNKLVKKLKEYKKKYFLKKIIKAFKLKGNSNVIVDSDELAYTRTLERLFKFNHLSDSDPELIFRKKIIKIEQLKQELAELELEVKEGLLIYDISNLRNMDIPDEADLRIARNKSYNAKVSKKLELRTSFSNERAKVSSIVRKFLNYEV